MITIRYRNEYVKRFDEKARVAQVIDFALAAQEQGWSLDISCHSDGLSFDAEGVTLHLVKISEKPEEKPDINDFLLSANRTLNHIYQEKAAKREKYLEAKRTEAT